MESDQNLQRDLASCLSKRLLCLRRYVFWAITYFKYIFHVKFELFVTGEVWPGSWSGYFLIGLAPWIQIHSEKKSWIRIRIVPIADPHHWFKKLWSLPSPKPAGTVAGSKYCTLFLWEQGAQEGEEEEGMRGRLVLLGRAPATQKKKSHFKHHRINGFGCFSPLQFGNFRCSASVFPKRTSYRTLYRACRTLYSRFLRKKSFIHAFTTAFQADTFNRRPKLYALRKD
jgi:hypothetical protein